MKLITITITLTDDQALELRDLSDTRDESTEGMIDDVVSDYMYSNVSDFDSMNVKVNIK